MNDSAEGNCAVTSRLSVPKAFPKQSGIALGVCVAVFVLLRTRCSGATCGADRGGGPGAAAGSD